MNFAAIEKILQKREKEREWACWVSGGGPVPASSVAGTENPESQPASPQPLFTSGTRQRGGWSQGLGGKHGRMGSWCWQSPHNLLPPFQVVASVVDQDSFSGFAPLQPQVRWCLLLHVSRFPELSVHHPAGENVSAELPHFK